MPAATPRRTRACFRSALTLAAAVALVPLGCSKDGPRDDDRHDDVATRTAAGSAGQDTGSPTPGGLTCPVGTSDCRCPGVCADDEYCMAAQRCAPRVELNGRCTEHQQCLSEHCGFDRDNCASTVTCEGKCAVAVGASCDATNCPVCMVMEDDTTQCLKSCATAGRDCAAGAICDIAANGRYCRDPCPFVADAPDTCAEGQWCDANEVATAHFCAPRDIVVP